MKVWLTVEVENSTRREIKRRANAAGMKMGPYVNKTLLDGLAYASAIEAESTSQDQPREQTGE